MGGGPKLKRKPAPDIFLEAARATGVPPQRCIVFEDALKGLASAKAAGMRCVIILNSLNEGIDYADADVIVPSHEAMLEIASQGGLS